TFIIIHFSEYFIINTLGFGFINSSPLSKEIKEMSQNLNIQDESQQQQEEIRQNTSNANMTSQNVILPSMPQRAFSRIPTVSSSPPTSTTSECLPTYSLAINDMPPMYPMDHSHIIINPENFEQLLYLEAPVQPQEIWP